MDKRLMELEIKMTFQENLVEELNEVIIRQQAQIDRLDQELKTLVAQFRSVQQLPPETTPDPPPPHY